LYAVPIPHTGKQGSRRLRRDRTKDIVCYTHMGSYIEHCQRRISMHGMARLPTRVVTNKL
jgi:hypothetical protein